jgi:trk system potassium uptake protein
MPLGPTISPLHYAVRPSVLARYLGQLLLALAALTAVPLAVVLLSGLIDLGVRLAGVALLLGIAGGLGCRVPAPGHLQANEALVVTALLFVIGSALMAVPLMALGLPFIDALFEAVSGTTTTGLTMLASIGEQPPAVLFTRAWIQWYGGLGIVVLVLALTSEAGGAARRLSDLGSHDEDLVGSTHAHALRALLVYLALTAAGFVLVWLAGLDAFTALVHTLAAVSTGGFSTFDASLEGLARPAQAAILLTAFAGAIALPLYYRLYRRDLRSFIQNLQLRALVVAALLISALLAVSLAALEGRPWSEAMMHGLLLGTSAQTTTGFSTTAVGDLHPASKAVLIVAMFIGGDLGSTAGGIKILRLLILLHILRIAVLHTGMPRHAVAEPRLGGQRLEGAEIERALLVILLFLGLVVALWIPFLAAGYDPLEALFEVTSAVGTVGLSTGITGPELAPSLKVVLCVGMLMGRLEVLAFLVLAYPGTWLGKRSSV